MADSEGARGLSALSRAECEALDVADPIAGWRERFVLPAGVIYLDGNSLGPLPKATEAAVLGVTRRQWGKDLITSWNKHGWVDLPQRLGAKVARLLGAKAHEVVVTDSISVNLFKLIAAALGLRPGRRAVVSERGNFPTDLYVAQGLRDLLGKRVELRTVATEELEAALDHDTALLMLTHVDYRSGRMHDMQHLTAAAHAVGALALWDLAHSAGAVPVDLNAAGADLAVGCGYKYLNGGPGAPAFLFVAERWHERVWQPITGWFGHARPFAFESEYQPAPGIARFLAGTPPILSMTALEAGIDLFLEIDQETLRAKSIALTDAFIALIDARCAEWGFALASPRAAAQRGAQVSLRHPEGYPIMQALIGCGVIGDFRAPDLLRFGFAPLYVRFVDVFDAVDALCEVMARRLWDQPAFRQRAAVT
jgi:kynureninase